MIDKLMTNSRNTEVSGSTMRIIGAYKTTTLSSDPNMVTLFTALEDKSTVLSASINRAKVQSVLDDKDALRDDKLRAIHYLLMGFLHHPNKKVKAAAETIENVYAHYGLAITDESYATESALIVSLLNDLAAEILQESISSISGLAELIAELQAAQDDFEQTRISYESTKAEEGTHANATASKKAVLEELNDKVVVYMRAMEIVTPETHGALARTIAEIIADNNEQVKKRRKKAGDKPTDED